MGWHRLGAAWTQVKGQAKHHWGQLPDDGFQEMERRRDKLARLFQDRFGVERDEADRQIDQWLAPYRNRAAETAAP